MLQSNSGKRMTYEPRPIDTSGVNLEPDIIEIIDRLSANNHDHWALRRLAEGWSFGSNRDDESKSHPDLVPFDQLSESEKEYDRGSVVETLKAILALGYSIRKL